MRKTYERGGKKNSWDGLIRKIQLTTAERGKSIGKISSSVFSVSSDGSVFTKRYYSFGDYVYEEEVRYDDRGDMEESLVNDGVSNLKKFLGNSVFVFKYESEQKGRQKLFMWLE